MASLTRLRLIQFRAGYNLPVHAGREQGIFERHGLEIDITYTPGSLYISDALRKGEFEIGHTGADDIVADVEDFGGGPSSLFIFMGLHSGLLSIVGAPGMTTVESLRGKELAVDARASGFVFILEKLLRSNGFGPDDYKFVEIGGVDRRYQALLEGKVAGTMLLPPFAGNAVARGCHLLARGNQIVSCYQGTVGSAKRSWAEQNRDLLVAISALTLKRRSGVSTPAIAQLAWRFLPHITALRGTRRRRPWMRCWIRTTARIQRQR